MQVCPEVYIVPLGTGNDLARVLGLGEGYSGDVHVREILDTMKSAKVVKLDRYLSILT
jgi:diacylglycerol kinase family enzyme